MDLKIIRFLLIFIGTAYFSSVKDIISKFEKIGQETQRTSHRSKQKLFRNEIKIDIKKFKEVSESVSFLRLKKGLKSEKEDCQNYVDRPISEFTKSDAQFELYYFDELTTQESPSDTSPESIISSKSWPAEKNSKSKLRIRFSDVSVLDMDEVNLFEKSESDDKNLDFTSSSKSFDYKSFQNDTNYNLAEDNNQELAENALNLPNDQQASFEIKNQLAEIEALSMNNLYSNDKSLLSINEEETVTTQSYENFKNFMISEVCKLKSTSKIQEPSTSKLSQDEQDQFIQLEQALDDLDKGVDLLLISKNDAKLTENNLSRVKEENETLENDEKQISIVHYVCDINVNCDNKTDLNENPSRETQLFYELCENNPNQSNLSNGNLDEAQRERLFYNNITTLKPKKKSSKKKRNKSSCFGRVFKKKKKYYDEDDSVN